MSAEEFPQSQVLLPEDEEGLDELEQLRRNAKIGDVLEITDIGGVRRFRVTGTEPLLMGYFES